ncbi:reverse transcriptase [Tanacetum coccineum]
MDFIEKLPSSHGKTVILVVVDRLSKYAYFMAIQHPFTASTVAQVFLDNVYRLYGMPNSILKMSTAYHPQTDGQTEIVNKCLECFLRCMTGERPKEWTLWLLMAEFWYNTNFHFALNTTPFQMVYGQTPPVHTPYISGNSLVESVDRTMKAREEQLAKVNNRAVASILVKWSNHTDEDATWENYADLIQRHPEFEKHA